MNTENKNKKNSEPKRSSQDTEVNGSSNPAMEEWKELRAEIARKQAFGEQIFVTVGAANFAVIAYGMKDCALEGAAVCLLPIIITGVTYLWLLTQKFFFCTQAPLPCLSCN